MRGMSVFWQNETRTHFPIENKTQKNNNNQICSIKIYITLVI